MKQKNPLIQVGGEDWSANLLLDSKPASYIFHSLLCIGQAFIVKFAKELKRVKRFGFFYQLDNSWVIDLRLRYKCDSKMLV